MENQSVVYEVGNVSENVVVSDSELNQRQIPGRINRSVFVLWILRIDYVDVVMGSWKDVIWWCHLPQRD